jgi:hypothetical protein
MLSANAWVEEKSYFILVLSSTKICWFHQWEQDLDYTAGFWLHSFAGHRTLEVMGWEVSKSETANSYMLGPKLRGSNFYPILFFSSNCTSLALYGLQNAFTNWSPVSTIMQLFENHKELGSYLTKVTNLSKWGGELQSPGFCHPLWSSSEGY